MGVTEPANNRMMGGPTRDEAMTQGQIMELIDQQQGYGFRIVGRMPRVKVYMTHLTRFKRRDPILVGTFKTKRAAHKKISEICNPKPKKVKKVKNEPNSNTTKDA